MTLLQVSPHPGWVDELNAALEPLQHAILQTPVVEHAAANRLEPNRIQGFLLAFYPIIRDFPVWLAILLERAPDDGHEFFRDNIRVERRHEAMWRAMGDAFGVPRERFHELEPPVLPVEIFHEFLTATCRDAPFGWAVSATNYAVEGMAQKISEKALRGFSREFQEGMDTEYDDEHPVQALEIVKRCVERGESPDAVKHAAFQSLALMREAMISAYRDGGAGGAGGA